MTTHITSNLSMLIYNLQSLWYLQLNNPNCTFLSMLAHLVSYKKTDYHVINVRVNKYDLLPGKFYTVIMRHTGLLWYEMQLTKFCLSAVVENNK